MDAAKGKGAEVTEIYKKGIDYSHNEWHAEGPYIFTLEEIRDFTTEHFAAGYLAALADVKTLIGKHFDARGNLHHIAVAILEDIERELKK